MDAGAQLRIYDFHGLRLGCSADSAVTAALASRLGRFPQHDCGPCELRFDYSSASAPHDAGSDAPPDARVIYESPMGQVLYSDALDRLFISSVWPIRAESDPRAGRTSISVEGDLTPHLWALSHPLLTIPLIEALKRRGYFSVHAAAVARGGKGLVIPGSSGSGKSTLALALARAGFDFMGDDMLFLVRSGTALRALALPEAFDLTDHTVSLFPDLGDLLAVEKQPGWPKYQLYVDERFGANIAWQCEPKLLVFPRVAASGKSSLSPMEPNAALLELLPNILLTESGTSQLHLEALSGLVASTTAYRLETGTDFGELAARLEQLLENA